MMNEIYEKLTALSKECSEKGFNLVTMCMPKDDAMDAHFTATLYDRDDAEKMFALFMSINKKTIPIITDALCNLALNGLEDPEDEDDDDDEDDEDYDNSKPICLN